MTNSDKPASWLEYAGSKAGPLGRHLERMLARRRSAAPASSAGTEPNSLVALIPIGLLTLFMLWTVINPV